MALTSDLQKFDVVFPTDSVATLGHSVLTVPAAEAACVFALEASTYHSDYVPTGSASITDTTAGRRFGRSIEPGRSAQIKNGSASLSFGAGAPKGICPTGSAYFRTYGGRGPTEYVCEGSTWVPK